MGKILTLARKAVESWDWTQNVYFDERNRFIEKAILVIPLVFTIIDIIELTDLWYLALVAETRGSG